MTFANQSALHPDVGCRIEASGLDIADPETVERIRRAAHEHSCVLLRAIDPEPCKLSALANGLGIPLPPYRPQYSLPDRPEIVQIGNIRKGNETITYLNRGGIEWHTDSPGSSRPPGYSLLFCKESSVPDGGGETGFVSTVAGYTEMAEHLRERIADIQLVQSFNTFNDTVAGYEDSTVPQQHGELRDRNQDSLDDMVQIHPVTGRRHIYVSHAMVKQVIGLSRDEGMKLVMKVVDALTRPHLVYKHVWQPGDLIVFDNRTCLHTPFPYAFDDFPRTRRLLYQIIIGGR